MAAPAKPTATKVAPAIAKKTPVVGLFTVGALAAAAWMIKDSFTGSSERINHRVTQLKENNDLAYTKYNWGQWSGNPNMDNLAQKVHGLKTYGPFNLKQNFLEMKMRVSAFFSEIIMPNLIPIGVVVAGLYGTFGAKTLHKPFRAMGKWFSGAALPKRLKQDLGRVLPKVGGSIGKGVLSILKWPFQSLGHLSVGAGITVLGAYFLKRFHDVSSGDAQDRYFRDELLGNRNGKF